MYKKITLELSLKPFKRTDDEYIKSVCEKIFNQWRPLVKDCETLSIMFWAALNDNYGLEIMGHMTRICELPGDEFMFRFYIHDPWWVNSPWYDRYGGEPIDIYMPSAVTRINEEGKVESAEILNFLSIDNSFGEMPDACVNEVIPHIIKAKKNAGDKPAPLVWVYPIREFSTATDEKSLSEMFYGDKFICEAINNSFPLNCVVSTDNFLKTSLSIYKSSVLISPVPENDAVREKIGEFIKNGGRVIFYGSAEKLACLCKVGAEKVDIASSPVAIREALAKFGYEIGFMHYAEGKKTTTMTIANSDNAMFFSLYNQTTALDMELKFPLGAPVFIGTDAIMEEGKAVYRFGRCEHITGDYYFYMPEVEYLK
ncbi:MAG: hypothetical protein E7671_02645 [Ruminococcaceae bacterium]|nr:hypothetical protein [Oscillospiraceae bacterium]